MKPFLKWPGNKYRLINKIIPKLPEGDRLIEPFVGSGAVFLNSNYSKYIISECNYDLIQLYRFIKKEKKEFIEYSSKFFVNKYNTSKEYYKLRELFNNTKNLRLKAAIFLYLNRHGYNGLCRYNNKGKYNVPFGSYVKPYFPREEMLFFSSKLQKAIIKCCDFRKIMKQAKLGDVVYCDPPYVPLSTTSNFTNYYDRKFSQQDQLDLLHQATLCANNNVPVLISNHDTVLTRKMYSKSKRSYLQVRRMISCKAKHRPLVREILALFKK